MASSLFAISAVQSLPPRSIEDELRLLLEDFEADPERAFAAAQEALERGGEQLLPIEQALALLIFGRFHRTRLRYAPAGAALQKAATLADESEDDALLVDILNEQGTLHYRFGDHRGAMRLHERALAILRTTPQDPYRLGRAYNNLAVACRAVGQQQDALVWQSRATQALRQLDDPRKQGLSQSNLGHMQLEAGRPAAAVLTLQQAARTLHAHGRPGEQLANAVKLARALTQQGEPEEAERVLHALLGEHEFDPQLEWKARQGLVAALDLMDRPDEALEQLHHALEIAEAHDLLPELRETCERLANDLRIRGRHSAACDLMERALDLHIRLSEQDRRNALEALSLRHDLERQQVQNQRLEATNRQLAEAYDAIHTQQAELVKARDTAKEAARVKSDFLARMSHEIRTPLNGVIGLTEVLAETQLNADQGRLVETIQRSGELTLSIINDILDFSKLEADRLVLEPALVEVDELLDDTLQVLAVGAWQGNIALRSLRGADVPERVHVDRNRLGQVMVNLVGNAIKFTERGHVQISMLWAEGRLRVEVQDTGVGVPKDSQARLFEPYAQADGRAREGTGLGLAICRRLIEAMDGTLGLYSAGAGQGSTFWFEIPVEHEGLHLKSRTTSYTDRFSASAKAARAPSVPTIVPSRGPASQRGRVLVVEDNAVNRLVAQRILGLLDLEAVLAEDGAKALELFEAGGFDLIFMDLQMPGMDGIEATKAIRAGEPKGTRVPIIALTADGVSEARDRCLAAGMDNFATKPIQAGHLGVLIDRWIPE